MKSLNLIATKNSLGIRMLMFALMCIPGISKSANITWRNLAGDNNWSTAGNWSPAVVPGVNDVAIFNATSPGICNIDTNIDVRGISMATTFPGTINQQNNYSIKVGISNFVQAGGTFNGGTGDIIIDSTGIFSQTGGVFNSTSGNLIITGSRVANQTLFTQTGGVFNHNNSTLKVNPSLGVCTQRTFTLNTVATTLFYNVIVQAETGCGINPTINTAPGDIIIATNDLSHFDGSISGKFAVRNNLFIGSNADEGTGTITVDGTGLQTYSVDSGSPRTCSMIINKLSGSFEPSLSTTELNVKLFTIQSGDFLAPPAIMDIGGTWTSSQTIFNHIAGNYIHNNGTLNIHPSLGSCVQRTYTLNVLPTTEFYNVILDGKENCSVSPVITTAGGDTLNAINDLTLNDGILAGKFAVKNNLLITASADQGTGLIAINGSGAQSYSVESGAQRTCSIFIDKPSGTAGPAVGTIDFPVNLFILNSGDFIAPPGNLDFGGTYSTNTTLFTQSGGNYIHNNGTLMINPYQTGCAQRTFNIDVMPGTNFYNIVLNPGNSCPVGSIINSSSSDTLNADNDLIHVDGVLNGMFSVKNDLIIDSASDGGTGSIIVNGTGSQSYKINSLAPRTCSVIVDKTSGTFGPDSSSTNFSIQDFSLLNGNFIAPSGIFSIGGQWASNAVLFSHSGGTFDANDGLVSIDPFMSTCTQRTFTIDVIPTTKFYDLQINGTSSCALIPIITTPVGDLANVSHNFIHNDGYISGKFLFKNNLFISSSADGGTGSITADGLGNQTYYVDSLSPRTCGIIVNKPSGVLQPGSAVTDFYVQYFNLLAGEFIAPAGVLNTGGTWTSSATLFSVIGGTYTHNNGTLSINPLMNSCAQRTYTLDVSPSTELFNLNLDANSTCVTQAIITTAAGDIVDATNNLTYSDGIVNGKFAVKKDLFITSSIDGGSGSIMANGLGNQTYNVDSLAPRICGLIVDKPSGSFLPSVQTRNFSVNYFSLVSGTFMAPPDTLNSGGISSVSQILYNQTGGIYLHNNGTLAINPILGGCTPRNFTIDVLPSTSFYNFEINGIPSCLVNPTILTAVGDIVNVTNNLSHVDGQLNGQFSVKKNLRIAADADLGTGTIYFEGPANQTYTFEAGAQRTCNIIINKAAGSVDPTVGTSNFLIQSTTLLSGDFTAPVGNLDIGGSWSTNKTLFNQTNGTFHHNNGTLVFNPILSGCTQRTFAIDVVPSTVFFNMVFNGIQSCGVNPIIASVAGDSLSVKNQLSYQDGICNTTVKQEGNTNVSPTFDGGNGALIFKGSNNQDFDLTGAIASFNGPITLDKSANNVNLVSSCVLDQGGTQSLNLLRGNLITTPTNLLTIGDNVSVTGGSIASYIDGPCRKTGNDAFSFPVGKNSIYAPISISAPLSPTDQYNAEFFPSDPFPLYNVYLKDPTLHHLSRAEYWILDRENGTSNTTVRLSWSTPGSGGVNQPADLLIGGWDGSMWKDRGNGGTTGTSANGTIVTSGVVNQYGPFTLTSGTMMNPLPIELTSFAGFCEQNEPKLKWSTASESNNDFFGIERSKDGMQWHRIGRVEGHGNSSSTIFYEFIDTKPIPEFNLYRLQQSDYDGQINYSELISVENCNEVNKDEIEIYPNPSNGIIHLTYHKRSEIKDLNIYNSTGIKVFHADSFNSRIDLSDLTDGIYFIHLVSTNNVKVEKFIMSR